MASRRRPGKKAPGAIERDETVEEGLRRSNARFMASMNRIVEQYNHPFEDDLLVSMATLTYDTPEGPKQWGRVSHEDVKKQMEIFKHNRQSQRKREITEAHSSDFEDEDSLVYQESPETSGVSTSDSADESDAIGSVRRKFEHIQLQSPNVNDRQILKKERVRVDVIVQDDERNIPKWMMITTPRSSKGHGKSLPVEEESGNQAAVCRKKLEYSNRHSSSKHLQLEHSVAPTASNTTALPRQQPGSRPSTPSCDSTHEEYQSSDEGSSMSNTTISDLYPAMLEILTKLMAKHSQRKMLKRMFCHLKSKKRYSRRPKLRVPVDKAVGSGACKEKKALHSIYSCRSEDNQNPVPVDKAGGSGACKEKKAFHSIYSCRREDNQNPTYGNDSREVCCDKGLISNSSALVPSAYTDTNEIKMRYSGSDLEQHLASRKGQEICKHTAFPDVMDRMRETFLAEDELQATTSRKNSEYTESEKLAYKHFSEPRFIASTTSSDSRALHLVKAGKTQKTDFGVGTSEWCSCAFSFHGNSNKSLPITNYSPARSSNTVFISPEKIIPGRQTSFQHKGSFSSCFMRQHPLKKPNNYEDAFEEIYRSVCSGEYEKSLTLTRPLLNSQNLEEKGRLVKSNLSDFGRSIGQGNREFDRLYEKLSVPGNSWESVPRFPGFQTVSNFRKYEELKLPENANALVYSPVRRYSAVFSIKRAGSSENCLPCSPLKRLKVTPDCCISSRKYQEISHSEKGNSQRAGMDFLNTYNCSNSSFFAAHNCHHQGFGSHDSSDKRFLGISCTSLQEPRTAGVHSCWPGAVENCSSLRNVRKHHPRVYRRLSYTDGKDQY